MKLHIRFQLRRRADGAFIGEAEITPVGRVLPRVVGRGVAPDKKRAVQFAIQSALRAAGSPLVTAALPGIVPGLQLVRRMATAKVGRKALGKAARAVGGALRKLFG